MPQCNPNRPGLGEIIRTIRHEIAPRIRRNLMGRPLLRIVSEEEGERRLIIDTGTYAPPAITIGRTGELIYENCRGENIQLTGHTIANRWNAAAEEQTRRVITEALHQFPKKVVRTASIGNLIWKEARKITRQRLGGVTPRAAVRAPLKQLLGKEAYNRTLRIAGVNATLREYELIRRDPRIAEEAHRLNPNAALIWFNHKRMEPIIRYRLPTPERMIKQVRNNMMRQYAGNLDSTDVWEAFCKLHPGALNRHTNLPPRIANLIADISIQAGVEPAFHAITAMGMLDTRKRWNRIVTICMIQEMARLKRAHPEDQREIIRQYQQIRPERLSPKLLFEIEDWQRSKGEAPPWSLIAEATGKPRHRGATQHTPPSASQREIREFLQENLPDLVDHTKDVVTVSYIQKRRLTITTSDLQKHILQMERGPGARVNILPGRYWTKRMRVPSAWTKGSPNTQTLRGLWEQTAGRAAARWIQQVWTGEKRLPGKKALARFALEVLEESGNSQKERLDHELQEGMRKLFDPQTLLTALMATGGHAVDIHQYNIAAMGRSKIESLQEHNPGALAWCMLKLKDGREINHPGQVVSAAREGLESMGVDPYHWKYIHRIGTQAMAAIMDLGHPQMIYSLNLIAQAQIVPTIRHIEAIREAQHRTMQMGTNKLHIKNTARALRLLPIDRDLENSQSREVWDYLEYLTNIGGEARSRTWRRLQNRATEWHRRLKDNQLQAQWERMIAEQGGQIWKWESLIGQTDIEAIIVTPLTNERELLEESQAMEHCIFTYGQRARESLSRLFSLSRNGNREATMEIALDGNSWEIRQVRGVRNHAVGPEFHQAALEIARLYTQEWQRGRRHQPCKEQI